MMTRPDNALLRELHAMDRRHRRLLVAFTVAAFGPLAYVLLWVPQCC